MSYINTNQIQILNRVSLTIILSCLISVIIQFFIYSPIIFVSIGVLLFYLVPFGFHYYRKYLAAKLWILIPPFFVMLGMAFLFGDKFGTMQSFVLFPLASLALFQERKIHYAFVVFSLLGVITYEMILSNTTPIVDVEDFQFMRVCNVSSILIVCFFFIDFFKTGIEEREQLLQEKNAILLQHKIKIEGQHKTLIQKQKELEMITDAMPACIAYVDRNYCYQFNNLAYKNWFGFDKEELVGAKVTKVIGEEGFKRSKPTFDKVFLGEKQSFESRHIGKTNDDVYLKVTCLPDKNQHNVINGLFIFGENITELKNKEIALEKANQKLQQEVLKRDEIAQALKVSERRYRELFEQSFDGILIVDNQTQKIIDCNSRILEIFKYDREHFLQLRVSDLLPSGSIAEGTESTKLDSDFEKLNRGEKLFFETMYQKANGELFDCEVAVLPILEDDNKHAIGVIKDISERKNQEKALKNQHAYLRKLIDLNPHIIFSKNKSGVFTMANKALADAYGTTVDHLIGKKEGDFNQNLGKDEGYLHNDAVVFESGEQLHIAQEKMILANNQTRWLQSIKTPIIDEAGVVEEILVVGTDITERIHVEEALQAEIEQRERTEIQLKSSNKELQHFAYITSHNLREPVANMIGLLALYNQENPNDDFNQVIVENLAKASQNIDRLVKDLHQIISIKKDINQAKVKIDLYKSLDRILSSIEKKVKESEAIIRIDFSEGTHIVGIKSYIDSILLNLLTNAIKYKSLERNPFIELETEIVSGKLRLSVKDNGLGIDLVKHKEKLFGLYNRFHHHVKGTGLGLYLVKTQIEAMGGTIEVHSELGKGTKFDIYFDRIG